MLVEERDSITCSLKQECKNYLPKLITSKLHTKTTINLKWESPLYKIDAIVVNEYNSFAQSFI